MFVLIIVIQCVEYRFYLELSVWVSFRWMFCWWEHSIYSISQEHPDIFTLFFSSLLIFIVSSVVSYICPVFRTFWHIWKCLDCFGFLVCVLWILLEMYRQFGLHIVVDTLYIWFCILPHWWVYVSCGCNCSSFLIMFVVQNTGFMLEFLKFFVVYLVSFPVYVNMIHFSLFSSLVHVMVFISLVHVG